jgi:hypothetical protein
MKKANSPSANTAKIETIGSILSPNTGSHMKKDIYFDGF